MKAEDIRILIVEDEVDLAEMVRDYLRAEGFSVDIVHNGAAVVELVKQQQLHMMLLDLMLPGKDGISICKEIRQFSDLPIIMVTARVEEIDQLLGLELGADDYICKPVRPREVVARVKAVLRRTLPKGTDVATTACLFIDEHKFVASINGATLDLTIAEFKLLKLLSDHEGRVYSRQQILNAIYSDDRVVTERSIDTHVKNLRKKIGEIINSENPIHSVYGLGYKWEGVKK